MLCLALDGYDEAVIIDPARPASFDTVLDAWATSSFPPGEASVVEVMNFLYDSQCGP